MNSRRDLMLPTLLWLSYFAALLRLGALPNLLVAWQRPWVVVAMVTFAALALMAWRWGRASSGHSESANASGLAAVLPTLVHLIPLFLLWSIGARPLSAHAATMTLGTAPTGAVAPAPAPTPLPNATPATLGDLYDAAWNQTGKRVSVLGLIIRPTSEMIAGMPPDLQARHPQALLYRFRIYCCAADAVPLGAVLIGVDPGRFPDDTWVQAVGTFTPPADQSQIGTFTVEAISSAPEPNDPYLHQRGLRMGPGFSTPGY